MIHVHNTHVEHFVLCIRNMEYDTCLLWNVISLHTLNKMLQMFPKIRSFITIRHYNPHSLNSSFEEDWGLRIKLKNTIHMTNTVLRIRNMEYDTRLLWTVVSLHTQNVTNVPKNKKHYCNSTLRSSYNDWT